MILTGFHLHGSAADSMADILIHDLGDHVVVWKDASGVDGVAFADVDMRAAVGEHGDILPWSVVIRRHRDDMPTHGDLEAIRQWDDAMLAIHRDLSNVGGRTSRPVSRRDMSRLHDS